MPAPSTPGPGRTCRAPGCSDRARSGLAHCRRHAATADAAAHRADLDRAAALLDVALTSSDPDRRAKAAHRFRCRAARGDFDALLDEPTRDLIRHAAASDLDLELGSIRVAIAFALSVETDPTRMALSLARLVDASVRTSVARDRRDRADPAAAPTIRLLDAAISRPDDPLPALASPIPPRRRNGPRRPLDKDKNI